MALLPPNWSGRQCGSANAFSFAPREGGPGVLSMSIVSIGPGTPVEAKAVVEAVSTVRHGVTYTENHDIGISHYSESVTEAGAETWVYYWEVGAGRHVALWSYAVPATASRLPAAVAEFAIVRQIAGSCRPLAR